MLNLNSGYLLLAPGLVAADEPQNLHTQSLVRFCAKSSYEAALIILLCGFADCTSLDGRRIFKQRRDFTIFGSTLLRRNINENALRAALRVLDVELDSINIYLRKSLKQQRFFQEVVLEAVYFFAATAKQNHTIAFLHLYRFLERVSYVFPLLYANETEDFKGTYDSFKSFISGDKGGELNFFQKFLMHCIDGELLAAPCTIDISGLSNAEFSYSLLIKYVQEHNLIFKQENISVEIQAAGLTSLLINIRNRFFHAASGNGGNISLVDIPSPDLFFSRLNPYFASWLFSIYFQILSKRVDRFA